MRTRMRELAAVLRARFEPAAGGERAGRRTFLAVAWLGAVALFRAAAGLSPRPAAAGPAPQLPPRPGPALPGYPGVPQSPGLALQPFRVGVRSLVVEGGSKPGDTITMRMTVDTAGSGAAAVPWNLYGDNAVLGSGTRVNVPAGTSFEVSTSFPALAGIHHFQGRVDPQNTLQEPPNEQGNNVSQTVTRTFADWPKWMAAAKAGVRTWVPQWISTLYFTDVLINAVTASGGTLGPPFSGAMLYGQILQAGAPPKVAQGVAEALAGALNQWAASAKVPGAPWYPSFATVPSPVAPPTPNVPTPLITVTQPLNQQLLSFTMKNGVGNMGSSPEAKAAIDEFCQWFTGPFEAWRPIALVTNVLGTGPVPAFAPPYSPVGPVVGGKGTSAPGGITGRPVWP